MGARRRLLTSACGFFGLSNKINIARIPAKLGSVSVIPVERRTTSSAYPARWQAVGSFPRTFKHHKVAANNSEVMSRDIRSPRSAGIFQRTPATTRLPAHAMSINSSTTSSQVPSDPARGKSQVGQTDTQPASGTLDSPAAGVGSKDVRSSANAPRVDGAKVGNFHYRLSSRQKAKGTSRAGS